MYPSRSFPLFSIISIEICRRESDIPKHLARTLERRKNCCGWREYQKLNVWLLTQYQKVVYLDSDQTIARNFDHLFVCPYAFLYTSGLFSALNGGMWVLRPSRAEFERMRSAVLAPDSYDDATGWFERGVPCRYVEGFLFRHDLRPRGDKYCGGGSARVGLRGAKSISYGFEGPQGFVWAYWTFRADPTESGPAAALDPCLYNNQRGHGCHVRTFGFSYIVHKGDGMRRCSVPTFGCEGTSLVGAGNSWKRRPQEVPCKPKFVIVAPRATGASDLYDLLVKHPLVRKHGGAGKPRMRIGSGETLGLFNVDFSAAIKSEHLRNQTETLNSLFPDLAKGEITGDVVSLTFMAMDIPKKIIAACPVSSADMKIIFLLRDPARRFIAVESTTEDGLLTEDLIEM